MINTIYSNDLPLTCGGFARKNEDDTYTIVLNPKPATSNIHARAITYREQGPRFGKARELH